MCPRRGLFNATMREAMAEFLGTAVLIVSNKLYMIVRIKKLLIAYLLRSYLYLQLNLLSR